MSRRLATSTLGLVGSQALYNGGLAIEFVLIVNWFGDIGQGSYSYALALAGLFEVGVHWGSQHLVNRDAAARFEDLKERLPGLFAASILTIACVVVAIDALHGPALATIAGAALVRAGAMLLGAICIGRGNIVAPAVARILSPLLALLVMWFVVRPDPTLPKLALATVAATIGYAGPLWIAVRRLGLPRPAGPSDWWPAWRKLAGILWPYLLLFFLSQLLFRVDGAVLKWLADEVLVARYMRAFKWIEGLFFLPHVVASAAIPVLVAASQNKEQSQGRILLQVAIVLALGLTVVSGALLVVAPPILELLLGAGFAESKPLFEALVWTLPVHGLGIYLAAALITQRLERSLLSVVVIAAMVGISAKLVGYSLGGPPLFIGGLYLGLIVHTLGCAWCLWRRRPV
jgi:O-antigen/teichoic acid export membrane protein